MVRGCFIGRFQPYHEGHHAVVQALQSEVDELVLGIGSADASHTTHDPFTGGERVAMLSKALTSVATPTYPIPIQDVDRNAIWVRHMETLCPGFDIVFSNNPLVKRLFRESNYEVRGFEMHNRRSLEGTEIRRRIIEGEPWRELVPDPVVTEIERIDGVERLKRVSETDANGDD